MRTDYKDEVEHMSTLVGIQAQIAAEARAAYNDAVAYQNSISGVDVLAGPQKEIVMFREQRMVQADTVYKILRGQLEVLKGQKREAAKVQRKLYPKV